jgi:hypothetical protein
MLNRWMGGKRKRGYRGDRCRGLIWASSDPGNLGTVVASGAHQKSVASNAGVGSIGGGFRCGEYSGYAEIQVSGKLGPTVVMVTFLILK